MSHADEALNENPPAFVAPPNSCDAHFHVFGPADRYPYGDELRYAPPLAPLGDYVELAKHLNLTRFVIVQPSAYGRDNRYMLDTMRDYGPGIRGVVDIDEAIADAELAKMHALGVRGVRINVRPIKPLDPGFSATMIPRIKALEPRLAELGWHLDFLGPGWLTQELMPTLRTLKVPFSLAHMGMFLAKDGPDQAGFQGLIDLLKHGDGRCWVKFTGIYRMATGPDFADAKPMAQALIDAAPDRLIWGSDHPHLSFADQCTSTQLFNLIADWSSDAAIRKQILADNPQVLFGF